MAWSTDAHIFSEVSKRLPLSISKVDGGNLSFYEIEVVWLCQGCD